MNHNRENCPPKKIVYIVVEGDVEIDYFNRINELETFPKLKLKCKKGNELSFPTFYQEQSDNEVFLLLDLDDLEPEDLRYQRIKELLDYCEFNNRIFISRYSFETWLLNHKKRFSALILFPKNYDPHMKKCFSVEHWTKEKTERNRRKVMESISVDDVNRAIKNCKSIYIKSGCDDLQINSVSTIFKLMICLKELNNNYYSNIR